MEMAEINSRKRKLSGQESVIEISDEDACLENSSESVDVEIVEPNAKSLHLDTVPSQSSDSNLEFATQNSQSSVDILSEEPEHAVDLKQRLLELDDELRLLKAENEELKSKSCSCQSRTAKQESVMTITFNNVENFRLYKDKLIKLFEVSLEFSIIEQESDLLINIVKDEDIDPNEWVVIDEDEVKTINGRPHKKKKKKPKASSPSTLEENDLSDLFVLDTTPSLSTKNNLKYESKFSVLNSPTGSDKDKQSEAKPAALATCFNCNESHNLRDCPKPKNFGKINAARQKFKLQQNRTTRYHMEDDQRFGNFLPGKISDKLQQALGLRDNQLPQYIYRMRQMGYPPGWFNEILAVQQSELVLFDFEGKDARDRKKTVEDLDPDKIVEYPGFNVPLAKGVKDEHRLYGCPPYSKTSNKESMLEYMRGMQKKAEDNLESCDMDIDVQPSDKEVESINTNKQVKIPEEVSMSPTLVELESKKLQLLEQLTDDVTEISQTEAKNSSEAFQTLDITGTVEELDVTVAETNDSLTEAEKDRSIASSPTPNLVKTSSFGTPILKSASPYCSLPCPENFSKDVSDVINFENLPNSTGKYEQMVGVLEKVRKTLKGMNEQKS